jgi:hydroxymethylglutaryl-CoA lyase
MVRIVEVGPRDGLQNEKLPVSTEQKLEFVRALAAAGLMEIEVTSFVSPKWVPQLADAAEVWAGLSGGLLPSALVPNLKGLERAISCGVDRISVFTAASDEFTRRNINMTVDESLAAFAEVITAFRQARPSGWVRAYVSTAFQCPYLGPVGPHAVEGVVRRLLDLGVDEISVGDTIGVATPREVTALLRALTAVCPTKKLALHFHDTRGTAIANVCAGLEAGVTTFDSSAGGLGGCPYAPGAGGNLATDDLVYVLERMGVPTGVDPMALARASLPILEALGRRPSAKAQVALLASAC